jgi:hypothetical protein
MSTVADVVKAAREKREEESKAKAARMHGEQPSQEPKPTFKAVKVDDQGVIIGVGASIGLDREEDTVEKGALLGMAYDFCASKAREFRANHDKDVVLDAELVCSWPGAPVLKSGKILEPGAEIPEDDAVVAINFEKGNETHWFVGIRPKDARVTEAARKGELVGFSWGGMALKAAE